MTNLPRLAMEFDVSQATTSMHPPIFPMIQALSIPQNRCPVPSLILGLLLAVNSLSAEQPPSFKTPALARKNEIKLFVTAENAEQAIKALKLDGQPVIRQEVCFFDTADGALEAGHLILRARQKDGEPGQSTVKIRAIEGTTELSPQERAIQPEQDWTQATGPTISRSADSDSLQVGLVSKVIAGDEKVIDLFNPVQRGLVMARMKDFKWENLKRYGPIEAEVWKQQLKLEGFSEKVTAEIWHLQKDGRTLHIFEVSAKAKAETEEQAQAIAKDFYGAAKAAGLGEPTGQTKTAKVLDFFKPGR